jgi:hypothetical protein
MFDQLWPWQCPSFQDFNCCLEQLFNGLVDEESQEVLNHTYIHNENQHRPVFNLLELQCFFQFLEDAAVESQDYLGKIHCSTLHGGIEQQLYCYLALAVSAGICRIGAAAQHYPMLQKEDILTFFND